MGCNEDKGEINNGFLINRNMTLYLSDGTVSDLDGLITSGGGAAAVYGVLVEKGILAGSLAGPVATVIGGIILTYWGMIKVQNDGCGVILKSRIPLGNTAPTVHSQ
ncbi:hypothetical protein [Natrinema saccharevitans]|uniref:hypothetical protein n=1 Tax=Natrinema saccharevitans TaxID=301967 RepID=UPI0011155CDE|nr:hypothetical protein [Natrinema saccharevitans]